MGSEFLCKYANEAYFVRDGQMVENNMNLSNRSIILGDHFNFKQATAGVSCFIMSQVAFHIVAA